MNMVIMMKSYPPSKIRMFLKDLAPMLTYIFYAIAQCTFNCGVLTSMNHSTLV